MNIIIVGAGEVGLATAQTISKQHDVLVIENDKERASDVANRLNVSVLGEDGTNPKNLAEAMRRHNPDMIISTLKKDDSNLFICLMAKRYDKDIITIASINDPDYMIETTSQGFPGVDHIISPELMVARRLYKLAVLENANDYYRIDEFDVCVCMFTVQQHHTVLGRIVFELKIPEGCSIFGIYRDDELHLDVETLELHVDDKICVMGSDEAMGAFNEMLGIDARAKDIIVLGGSIVGSNVVKFLSEDKEKRYVKLIEKNRDITSALSRNLSKAIIINADYTDPEVQKIENVFKPHCLVCTSHSDDTNLLMCMSAAKHNTNKVVTRYFKKEYEDIFMHTGMSNIVGFHRVIANQIIKTVLVNEPTLLRLREANEVFFRYRVHQSAVMREKYLGDLSMPGGCRIVMIRRGNQTIYPTMTTRILQEDILVVFTNLMDRTSLRTMFDRKTEQEL
ncbi:MAG: NAD-binding protein [Candidatus Methanomethylophilaceae archaeon]|nr:NAD-binding protein [Candidatus Methanomethylophilaceae archaeon]